MPAASSEHDLTARNAHVFRCDDFVRGAVLNDAILMNTRAVCEGVCPDHGLIGLYVNTRNGRDEATCVRELGRIDVGMRIELSLVHLDCHDDFFHGSVSRALTQAVDGALDLRGTVHHARKRKRSRHAQVVVTMHGNADILDTSDVLHEVANALAELPWHAEACGVGDVHDRRTGLDDGLEHAGQVFVRGAPGILGVELDIVNILAGMTQHLDRWPHRATFP